MLPLNSKKSGLLRQRERSHKVIAGQTLQVTSFFKY
jgi:hypothetical protein